MMVDNPLVSVVIPVRNGSAFVGEAVNSILSQTLNHWELILVDDGSEDDTVKLCKTFKDERIRLLTNSCSLGIPRALNRGIKTSRGRFIARLDADDIAMPPRLEVQSKFLNSNPEYGIVGSWMKVFGASEFVAKYPLSDQDIKFDMLFQSPFGHPAVMFRRDWEGGRRGLYNEQFAAAQDFDLWERISREWKCANLDECLTSYRLHPHQQSNTNATVRLRVEKEVKARQMLRLGLPPLQEDPSLLENWLWWRAFSSNPQVREQFDLLNIKKAQWRSLRRASKTKVLKLFQSSKIPAH